jgi:hypothetical protein
MNHKRSLKLRKERIMNSRNARHLFSLLIAVFWAATSFAKNNDYSNNYRRITQMREDSDIVGLEKAVRKNSGKNAEWSQMGKEEYGKLMAHALKSWNSISSEADDQGSKSRIQEYAEKVLYSYNTKETNNLSIETEFDLVSILHEKYTYSKGQLTDHEWSNTRRKGATAFLHVWQRLEKAQSEDVESNDLPEENVDIPEGVRGFPGMSPKLIKDPIQRAEYEKVIRANKKKIAAYNKRVSLQNSKKRYFSLIKKYLVLTYNIAPYDSRELRALLEAYVKHPDTRASFMDGVAEP